MFIFNPILNPLARLGKKYPLRMGYSILAILGAIVLVTDVYAFTHFKHKISLNQTVKPKVEACSSKVPLADCNGYEKMVDLYGNPASVQIQGKTVCFVWSDQKTYQTQYCTAAK